MGLFGSKIVDQGYRIVAIKPGTKAPTEKNWQRFGRQQDGADVEHFVRTTPDWGIGIPTAFHPAIDIDVRDPTLALELQELAVTMLGEAPVRIGALPKRLLLYRTDEPFAKIASRGFRLPSDLPEGKPHQIEILGDGQQFVAYGLHPGTGRPYEWPDDSPLDIAADDLTPITVEQVRAYIEAAEALLIGAGGKPIARMAEDTGPRKANAKLTAYYDLIADAIAACAER